MLWSYYPLPPSHDPHRHSLHSIFTVARCPYTLKGEALLNWIEDRTRYFIALPHPLSQRPPSRVVVAQGSYYSRSPSNPSRILNSMAVGLWEPVRLD